MAKRRYFIAELTDSDGRTIATAERFAWNSTIKASEDLVRQHARSQGQMYAADRPDVYGPVNGPASVYSRRWTGMRTGEAVRVRMAEVHS